MALSYGTVGQPSPLYNKNVTLKFSKRAEERMPDSVWVIFDRYDLTGPGIINRIYSPKQTTLLLENVPAGKYFVDIICFGLEKKQYFSTITTIGKRRKNTIELQLQSIVPYLPGSATIPSQTVDFSKLEIFRTFPIYRTR
jgi:hypothetical protein